jgi:hypothetical protein
LAPRTGEGLKGHKRQILSIYYLLAEHFDKLDELAAYGWRIARREGILKFLLEFFVLLVMLRLFVGLGFGFLDYSGLLNDAIARTTRAKANRSV